MQPRNAGRHDVVAQQTDVVGVQEFGHRAQDACSALLEDVTRLASLQPRIERHQHPACRLQTDRGYHPFVDVRRPDPHAIARFDTGGAEGPCSLHRRSGEVRKAQGEIALLDGSSISEALGGASNQSRNRLFV